MGCLFHGLLKKQALSFSRHPPIHPPTFPSWSLVRIKSVENWLIWTRDTSPLPQCWLPWSPAPLSPRTVSRIYWLYFPFLHFCFIFEKHDSYIHSPKIQENSNSASDLCYSLGTELPCFWVFPFVEWIRGGGWGMHGRSEWPGEL